jgi:hypothetical protein
MLARIKQWNFSSIIKSSADTKIFLVNGGGGKGRNSLAC